MSKQIQIPDIGSDEVTVTEVMVNVGDTISVDQSIINVEGDKASMEVPAPEAGVVKEVLVKVGDKVSTGTPMLVLEAAGAAPAADAPTAPVVATAPTASAIVEVNVPDIDLMKSMLLKLWLKWAIALKLINRLLMLKAIKLQWKFLLQSQVW